MRPVPQSVISRRLCLRGAIIPSARSGLQRTRRSFAELLRLPKLCRKRRFGMSDKGNGALNALDPVRSQTRQTGLRK